MESPGSIMIFKLISSMITRDPVRILSFVVPLPSLTISVVVATLHILSSISTCEWWASSFVCIAAKQAPGCGREATPVSFKACREARIEDDLERLHLHCLGGIQLCRELYFPDLFYRSTLPSCQDGCDALYLSCSVKMSELWLPTSLPAIVASDIAASLCRILDKLFFPSSGHLL